MLSQLLKSFQLTPKEIKVFQKSLALGPQPASHLARVTELPRNTVASLLDGLVKKGLMLKTRRANTQYYATERKEQLIKSLRHKKRRADEDFQTQIELLETYGDELNARHFAATRPKITFYEGLAGLEKVYEDTLTAETGLLSWASADELLTTLPEYFKTYFKRRARAGIPMRSIHPDTPLMRGIVANDAVELRESALVPPEQFAWTPEIQIYNNKVNIASWKEKLGIIIESAEIAEAMRAIFAMSFLTAQSFKKESKRATVRPSANKAPGKSRALKPLKARAQK